MNEHIDPSDRKYWPGVLFLITYGLTSPGEPNIEEAFYMIYKEQRVSSRQILLATRAALASDLDLAKEIRHAFAHPDAVIRQFLREVEARLGQELGQ